MSKNNVSDGHKEKQSYANTRTTGKEQYYTSSAVVDTCIQLVKNHVELNNYKILEPAGGTGEFIEGFIRAGVNHDNIVSFDIEPKHTLVKLGDYLETSFEHKDYVSITNPPFGRASSLAKKFFNHAANHCKYICYLVPKAWRKWSVHNSLDNRFHLVAEIEMPKNCFYQPNSKESKKDVLNTVFQIWERREEKRKKITVPDHKLIKKIVPKDNKITGANFQIIAFGHSCGKCSEITDNVVDYKTTTMYLYVEKEEVKDALKSLDLSQYFNNVSYVQALSIKEINFELNKKFNLSNETEEE